MEQYPKISIITPSYNQGRFIKDAIESVLQQKYSNFEHIIIDGGSSDNTIEILKEYPHLIWISEPDKGQSDAINKGFKIATGDIIGWLNTDDYYLPNTFFIVSENLLDDKFQAVYGNSRYVDAFGNITSEQITQKSIKWMSLFKCFIPSETFFFKSEILKDNIFVDENFHIAMDMELFAHIYYSNYKIKKINAFFGHFRWHESNKSLDTGPTKLTKIKEGLEIFNRYSKCPFPKNRLGIVSYKILSDACGLLRVICRKLKIGIYCF